MTAAPFSFRKNQICFFLFCSWWFMLIWLWTLCMIVFLSFIFAIVSDGLLPDSVAHLFFMPISCDCSRPFNGTLRFGDARRAPYHSLLALAGSTLSPLHPALLLYPCLTWVCIVLAAKLWLQAALNSVMPCTLHPVQSSQLLTTPCPSLHSPAAPAASICFRLDIARTIPGARLPVQHVSLR